MSKQVAATGALIDDAAWSVAARAAVALADAKLARRFDAGVPADRLIALRARAVDVQVRAAWQRCFDEAVPLALFAVGGYGRGELFPHSDIDLLVLAEPAAQQQGETALARFNAMLWDAGLQVSMAVRSAQECTQAAADITVVTALIEARPLCANDADVARLADAVSSGHVWPPARFFAEKCEEQRRRHARFGDTSDNLEPNLKDGPGGLRDLHLLGWLALRSFGARSLDQMIELGRLGFDEAAALERER
ncbi:MAG: nucleotidyltransferase domain-containing protein, partial [Xanthomonadaceae bacterium]|nr:nucleotidyltransferase domain-containing protein [Xanthomonadaceae bacterium]